MNGGFVVEVLAVPTVVALLAGAGLAMHRASPIATVSLSQPTGPRAAMRSGTVAILLAGMLVTAVVRGAVALVSTLIIAPVFGVFDISGYDIRWAGSLWLLDWCLTACGVIASVLIVLPGALRPVARRRAAHVLAWMMAADAVIYLASFAVTWPFWVSPGSWNATGWWAAAGISVGSLCTFWTALVVLRRTAHHRAP
jgi:hypothetical protein